MRKRYYSQGKDTRKSKKSKPEATLPDMIPVADKSLKPLFRQIGIPVSKPFVPDPFQTEAIEAILHSDCLVMAPTGAGKTWIAEKAAWNYLKDKGRVWYATPLKALTNSIYAQFKATFGPESVGILTGDFKENPDAHIIIGTTEILRNQLYDAMHSGQDLGCDLVILDEAHFLGDPERGVVWEEIIIYLPVRVPILLLSATIGNPGHISDWLTSIRKKPCRIIQETERPVPLVPLFFHPSGTLRPLLKPSETPGKKGGLHKSVLDYLKTKNPPEISLPGRLPRFSEILKVLNTFNLLPAIFFLKSRADCDQAMRLCTPELIMAEPQRHEALKRRVEELVSGNEHLAGHRQRALLEHTAVCSHHSGQLPAWKVVVETLMAEGHLDAMFATSTVAAGVNFPARSVVILNSDRFNGTEFLPLTASDFQQMTGRAGRRGKDNIGFALLIPGRFMDLRHACKMLTSPPKDVRSQIRINFSMVLNLLLSHTPGQIRLLLDKSFTSHMIRVEKLGGQAGKNYGTDLEYLWNDFMVHLDFLKREGFVTEDNLLTEDGLWASGLRIDSPLLVAESLRKGLFPAQDPVQMAAFMASFVNEKEFDDERLMKRLLPVELIAGFAALRKGLKPFATRMLKQGFAAPNLYMPPAAALFYWAGDTPWEVLVERSEFAEGDLARLVLRTGEHLRQLAGLKDSFPEIALCAEKAADLILKEPVMTWYA
ncbi:MAG: DEAD/DEAH box helicase [Pseudomonadota bacterium]